MTEVNSCKQKKTNRRLVFCTAVMLLVVNKRKETVCIREKTGNFVVLTTTQSPCKTPVPSFVAYLRLFTCFHHPGTPDGVHFGSFLWFFVCLHDASTKFHISTIHISEHDVTPIAVPDRVSVISIRIIM